MQDYWKPFEGQCVEKSFYLRELLGHGTFGGVFRADHLIEDRFIRSVALKLIRIERDETGQTTIDRELSELIAAANLHHPHLVSCFHAGSAEVGPAGTKFLYLVMELAEGSLRSRLKEGILSTAEASKLIEHVASGLTFLHQRFTHRDIKPDNILRVGDAWKVSDYGLVRRAPAGTGHTMAYAGTLRYIPPEGFAGVYGPAFDIWSLGVLLVEALTGRMPFGGSTVAELIHGIVNGQPQVPLGDLRPFDRIVQGCLIKDYHARWTGEQVLAEIRLIRDEPVRALSDATSLRYAMLAVLLEDMVATPEIQQALWNIKDGEARDTAEELIRLSLAHRDGTGIRLDKRQMDGVCAQWPDRQALDLIHGAVRLSKHVIVPDPLQFASQVAGRLSWYLKSPSIETLFRFLLGSAPKPCLFSLNFGLEPPGTALIRTLAGHSDWVRGVAVSGDGRLAVSASFDRMLKVWDLETGRMLRTLEGHSKGVSGVALSGDGRLAVSASFDHTLKVWDLQTGQDLRTLTGHTNLVAGVALSGDGLRAVSASWDQTLKVWDVATGRELRTLKCPSQAVRGVAVNADGRRAVAFDHRLRVWDLETGQELRILEGHLQEANEINGVALTGDGRLAVSASKRQTLTVWDVEAGKELRTLSGHSGEVLGVALSGDGRLAVSTSRDGTLRVWDVETGREVRALRGDFYPFGEVALSSDGRRAVASSGNTLKVWRLDGGADSPRAQRHSAKVYRVAVSGDGRRAVSASEDSTLKVWDAETCRELGILKGHSKSVLDVAVNADGRRALSASSDQTLKMWDLGTGQALRSLLKYEDVWSVAASADGRRAISASQKVKGTNTLTVWDMETGRELRTLKGRGLVGRVALSGDGRRAVSASKDKTNTLKVWDVESGLELRTFTGHSDRVRGVALSLDGRRAVSASNDRALKVWDVESGSELRTLTGHSAPVSGVALSPDGQRVLSASEDSTVKLWDVETGRIVATFTCDFAASCCAFAGADRVVAGDGAGRVYFLQLLS